MSYPSKRTPSGVSQYEVQPADENMIIQSGNARPSLTSILPDLGTVSNGFTVGFTMNEGIPHTIIIRDKRPENIALPFVHKGYSGYVKSLSLPAENEVVWLTIDEVGNWRITGGTAHSSIPYLSPQIVETGERVAYGHKVPYLDENAQFSGSYLGWVTEGPSPVIGAPNVQICGTTRPGECGPPTAGEKVGVRIQWNAETGNPKVATAEYVIESRDSRETVAQRLASLIVAQAELVQAGFFTYAIPGSNRLNIQWMTNTTGPVVVAPINSAHVSVIVPFVSEAADSFFFQLGRTYGRVAKVGDMLMSFDWTGPDGKKPQHGFHWGQIAVQIMDPDPAHPKARMYFTSRVRPSSGEPMGAFYTEDGGIVLYGANESEPDGGSMGPGTINLPLDGGIYINGQRKL